MRFIGLICQKVTHLQNTFIVIMITNKFMVMPHDLSTN